MTAEATQKYGTLLTAAGKRIIANAVATNTQVNIKYVAIGDGGGEEYHLTEDHKDLVNQVYEAEANGIYLDPDNENRIYVELAIPEDVGGFWIREAAIKSVDGEIIALATSNPTYKPRGTEGTVAGVGFKFILEVSNADKIVLNLDPSMVYATIFYVNNVVNNHKRETNVHGGTYFKEPNRLMLRNEEGRCQVEDPLDDADATPKWWVERYVADNRLPPGGSPGDFLVKNNSNVPAWAGEREYYIPKLLTSNINLYIDPNGNDATGDGTLNNPWASPHRALNELKLYMGNGYTATIRCNNGTYNLPASDLYVSSLHLPGGEIVLTSTTESKAAVQLTYPAGFSSSMIYCSNNGRLSVRNVTFASNSSSLQHLAAANFNSSLDLKNVDFNLTNNAHVVNAFWVLNNANLTFNSNSTDQEIRVLVNATASVTHALIASTGGNFTLRSNTGFYGTLNVDTAFALIYDGGRFGSYPGTWKITGNAFGKRYLVGTQGMCNTYGSGENFFPGSIAGEVNSGGIYL